MNSFGLVPVVLTDIFPEKHIEKIYDAYEYNKENNSFDKYGVAKDKFNLKLDKSVFEDFIKRIFNKTGRKINSVGGIFIRYKNTSIDNDSKYPSLYPHTDTSSFKKHNLTMSIQLKSTLDWPIYVEDTKFDLQYNSGVLFSGTADVHWRPKKNFKDSDFLDVVVIHFYDESIDYDIDPESFAKTSYTSKEHVRKYKKELGI